MSMPSEVIPRCPVRSRPMSMNLRSDNTFAENESRHAAAARYRDFRHRRLHGHALYLDLDVNWNDLVIVKFPFWKEVERNLDATNVCVNLGEAVAPAAIGRRRVLMNGDTAAIPRVLVA